MEVTSSISQGKIAVRLVFDLTRKVPSFSLIGFESCKLIFALTVIVILSFPAVADRKPLERPEIDIDLGDTSNDWEILNDETGRYVRKESSCSVRIDSESSKYIFRFQGPSGGPFYTAEWMPLSQFDLTIATAVEIDNGARILTYAYTLNNAANSGQAVRRFIFCGMNEPTEFSLPSKTWRFRRGWKGNEDYWHLSLEPLAPSEGIVPGDTLNGFSVSSSALPALVDVKAVGWGPTFLHNNSPLEEVPLSIERALRPYLEINDCVSGQVVGPGTASVTVDALRRFLKASIENGWLEIGTLRDQIEALVGGAVDAEAAGKRETVLTRLRELRDLVNSAYGQGNASILSEAHALLYFNAQYLIVRYEERDVSELPKK